MKSDLDLPKMSKRSRSFFTVVDLGGGIASELSF